MFDAVRRAEQIAGIICLGEGRKYSRFRPSRFYGGIATADCVGCNLQCIFCWSYDSVIKPHSFGEFHNPEEVARRLVGIASKKGYRQLRISGGEPTLSKDHLLKVLDLVPKEFRFILETNGILIGHDDDYARALSKFQNLHVRVSLKGTTEEEFSRLTGAKPSGFELQLRALENLVRAGVATHAAVMVRFSPPESIVALQRRLGQISRKLHEIEIEELVFFNPGVGKRLRKAGVAYQSAYRPDNIPPDQV